MTLGINTSVCEELDALYFVTTISGRLVHVNRLLRLLLASSQVTAASNGNHNEFESLELEGKLCYVISYGVACAGVKLFYAPIATANDDVTPVQWLTRLVVREDGSPSQYESIGIVTSLANESRVQCAGSYANETQCRFSYANALEHVAEHVAIMDLEGRIEVVNHSFEKITGLDRSQLIGRHIREFWGDMFDPGTAETVFRTLKNGRPFRGERVNRTVSGELYFDEVVISPLRKDGFVTGCVAIGRDTSSRHLTDPLTGLQSRRMLLERIELALARSQREVNRSWALLFLDVDRFKAVNDTYGKELGDHVLLEISHRIQRVVRDIDAIAQVGHLNRDEFAVLLEGLRQPSDAGIVTERILRRIRKPIRIGSIEVVVTVSVGVVVGNLPYLSAEDVIRDAETAMVQAKRGHGGDCQFFDPKLHQAVVAKLALTGDLRRAINKQEFELHYQPLVSMSSWRIVGFEALVRWQHPENGFISPGEFIPIAEETGLIIPLGSLVLWDACLQLLTWQRRGLTDLHLSVNVSTRQFGEPGFEGLLASIIARTQVNAYQLKLEVTESTAAEEPQRFSAILTRLRRLGIEIFLDDFGTGYSSLNALTQFPIDKLKIDRAFVKNVPGSEHDNAVLTAIIAMAKSLGLGIVAEGVETIEQLEFLQRLGCDLAQGYLFSPPVSASKASEMLDEQECSSRIGWTNFLGRVRCEP